jgi:hypothetical protein
MGRLDLMNLINTFLPYPITGYKFTLAIRSSRELFPYTINDSINVKDEPEHTNYNDIYRCVYTAVGGDGLVVPSD